MMKYAVKKICTLIITLLLISMITFAAFSVIPGDAALAKLGTNATPERVEALREELGLNDSLIVRYGCLLYTSCGEYGEGHWRAGSLVYEKVPYTCGGNYRERGKNVHKRDDRASLGYKVQCVEDCGQSEQLSLIHI